MTTPARRAVPLAGVVLTGGASRRMGRDKATLPLEWWGGRTLVEYVVDVVGQRCAPVFVMAARGQPLPELPAQVLSDEVAGAGPLPAVGRGLRAAAVAGAERAFVCAVDMPSITVALIDSLSGPVAADVVLPFDGRDHYLAAVYRTGLARHIEALVAAGERRMGALIDGVDAARIAVPESSALTNVNSPADLRALAQPKPCLPAPADRDEL